MCADARAPPAAEKPVAALTADASPFTLPAGYVLSTTVLPKHIPHLHALYLREHARSNWPSAKSLPSLHALLQHALLTLLLMPTPSSPSSPPVAAFLVLTGDPLDPLIEDVIVHESARGAGLGRFLVQRALAWAWQRGASRVELYCASPVAAFYGKLGFQRVRGADGERCLMRHTHQPHEHPT